MIQYIQLIIFIFLLGTFLYYQKDKIIDKFNSYSLNSFENFQNTGIGLGISNLFSIEKPKILTNEVNITTEGIPTIVISDENDFTNQVSFFLQNFVSLLPINDHDNVINNLINVNNNKANLMIVQEEMLHNAITGRGIFQNNPLKNLRFVTGLYYETFMLLTYPESGINSWKDIKGKISLAPGANVQQYEEVLAKVEVEGEKAFEELKTGDVAAFFAVEGGFSRCTYKVD
jgi:hypothetical protein